MINGGTTQQIFLSVTDDDIRKACRKYSPDEEKFDFGWAIDYLIEFRDMIKKAWSILDSVQQNPSSTLKRLAESASDQFLTIFNEVKNYKQQLETSAGGTTEHNRIAGRLERFIKSVTTRDQWNKENGDLQPNNVLDAYLLAQQIEQQTKTPPDASALKDRIETLEGRAKTIEESLSSSAGKEAVRAFGQHFTDEATSAPVASRKYWLILGFSTIVLLITFVIIFSLYPATPLFSSAMPAASWSDPGAISHIIEKLLLLSIVAFVARFSFHQYSIRMHLLSTYRQKAVLANTFELLLASETMAARRDLIMTEVLGSLATFVPTGYIRKNAPELHPLAEIANLIASFKGKEGK